MDKKSRELRYEFEQKELALKVKQTRSKELIKQKNIIRREKTLKNKKFTRIWLKKLTKRGLARFARLVEDNTILKAIDTSQTKKEILQQLLEKETDVLYDNKEKYIHEYGDEVANTYNHSTYLTQQNLFIKNLVKRQFPIGKQIQISTIEKGVQTVNMFEVNGYINEKVRLQHITDKQFYCLLKGSAKGCWVVDLTVSFGANYATWATDILYPISYYFAQNWLQESTGQVISCLTRLGEIKEFILLKRSAGEHHNKTTRDDQFIVTGAEISNSLDEETDLYDNMLEFCFPYVPIYSSFNTLKMYSLHSVCRCYEWDFRQWSVLYKNTVYCLGIILKQYKPFGSYAPYLLKHVMTFL